MLVRSFYIKDIANIAGPIILGNLGFILIGVGDVIVAGRHSTNTLAAVSLATAIINCIMIFGIGILCSISAVLSNYRGAGKEAEKYFYPSLKFAAILSLIMSIAVLAFIPLIDKLGFEPELVPLIKDYFWITSLSIFGAYLHCMAKEFLQAFEIVIFPNILTVICIFVNVGLNILLAFGYGIIPEMGTAGLALASLITRYIMGFVLFLYCFKKVSIKPFKDAAYYKDLLKVGLPASLAVMIEFIGFNAITVILGRISGIYAAAQNIVCTLTSVSFMVPLAISNATAVKVGFANGAKYYKSLKTYAYTGIGMSEEYLPHIFEEFTRERTTTESHVTGTGLGLPIVKALVDLMGGTINVSSKAGKGTKTTIVLSFPTATEEQIQSRKEEQSGQILQNFKGKRILLAEDNELNAEIAMELLGERGLETEHVTDGVKCVETLKAKPEDYYDLILMDIQMPHMDGYEATKVIRALNDPRSRIPIIAMTANAFEEDRQRAFEAGMDGHIAKPISINVLFSTLDEVLGKS